MKYFLGTRSRRILFGMALVVGVSSFVVMSVVPRKVEMAPANWHPGHYVFVGMGSANISPALTYAGFRGVQKAYRWKDLEPGAKEGDPYNFSSVKSDLAKAKAAGRYLVIQLQWKSFVAGETYAPSYIANRPNSLYEATEGTPTPRPLEPCMWDPYIAGRWHALINALATALKRDSNYSALELVMFPESALSAADGDLKRFGYVSRSATLVPMLKENMLTLKRAFPTKPVLAYVNWPTGLYTQDKLHTWMKNNGIGMGAPDIRPLRPTEPFTVYGPALSNYVPLGSAVQWKTMEHNWIDNPDMTPRDIFNFSKNTLKLNYIFWQNSNPSGFRQSSTWQSSVRTMVSSLAKTDPAGGLNSTLPGSLK